MITGAAVGTAVATGAATAFGGCAVKSIFAGKRKPKSSAVKDKAAVQAAQKVANSMPGPITGAIAYKITMKKLCK